MRFFKTLSIAGIAGTLLALAAAPASADALSDIMAAKKIRVATDLAIPPSGMLDADLKPTAVRYLDQSRAEALPPLQ